MHIHHLNCGTMCPLGGGLMDGFSKGVEGHLVCHCLLIETRQGLVLVDTGLSLEDTERARQRVSPFFRTLNQPKFSFEESARHQVEALGFSAADVRHIVITHLDFDHAGGLQDFPVAKVHVYRPELEAARRHSGFIGSQRYRSEQWARDVNWQTYVTEGESWFGFDCVRALEGVPPEILMVPLIGHTWGHCGVAVDTGKDWLLHAGDAYFYREEMNPFEPHCTPGLSFYQTMMEVDREQRLYNQRRLRGLIREHSDEVKIFSSHDTIEYRRLVHVPAFAQQPQANKIKPPDSYYGRH